MSWDLSPATPAVGHVIVDSGAINATVVGQPISVTVAGAPTAPGSVAGPVAGSTLRGSWGHLRVFDEPTVDILTEIRDLLRARDEGETADV